MRGFFIVLKFEFFHYLKNKIFLASTIIICLLIAIAVSIPTIKDQFFGAEFSEGEGEVGGEEEYYGYILDGEGHIPIEDVKANFVLGELIQFENIQDLEEGINSREIEAGFIIQSPTQYQYVIRNNEMMDSTRFVFEEALIRAHRALGFKELGISYGEVEHLIDVPIQSDTKILGKDSASNYPYTYILVFVLYFIIVIYGQMIATSIASEKNSRAMEVLITSTDSSNLIFGKVLGGALAGALQVCIILTTALISYDLNAQAWDHSLDFLFEIPGSVLAYFAVFGVLGYLFYAFIYGALGALVSRTEDVNTSSTPITIMFIAVFAVAVIGMYNTEGLLLKITSFIPFSSFMSMFVRVSMGTVSTLEIILSLGILIFSTLFVGVVASMIYRLGTLMYGNPIKLGNAIKLLRAK